MELTNEEVVTRLLASEEIIKETKSKYISNPTLDTLGDFLLNIDEEYIPQKLIPINIPKYIFIKQ